MKSNDILSTNEKKRFNLNGLIPEELREQARTAGRAARAWEEKVEWHRQNDPDFEKWYAEEHRKIRERAAARTVNKTLEEFNEIHRKHRGLS